jgi:hypothetical protein
MFFLWQTTTFLLKCKWHVPVNMYNIIWKIIFLQHLDKEKWQHTYIFHCSLTDIVAMIVWLLDLQLPVHQCRSQLKLWVRTHSWQGVLDTTLCDKVYQWLATGRWFSPVSSINKADHHNITEILLKVVLSTINQSKPSKTRRQKSLEF